MLILDGHLAHSLLCLLPSPTSTDYPLLRGVESLVCRAPSTCRPTNLPISKVYIVLACLWNPEQKHDTKCASRKMVRVIITSCSLQYVHSLASIQRGCSGVKNPLTKDKGRKKGKEVLQRATLSWAHTLHRGLDLHCAANGQGAGCFPAASATLNMNTNSALGPCILWDATGTGLRRSTLAAELCSRF